LTRFQRWVTMIQPLIGVFKMIKIFQNLDWEKKIIIISIFLGIFLGLFPLFESKNPESQIVFADFSLQKTLDDLAMVGGNSLLATANPSGSDSQIRRINVVITGYSSSPRETDNNPFLTASGKQVEEGIVANNLLPFGTKVRMPELYGDRVFIVEDRMHWRKGYYHFDIWFSSYWEALDFGAQKTYIEILEN
jgi:3D (Asp-Asp-Asp) domain-containing protein